MTYSFLQPYTFNNGTTLKNRILMAPMTTSSSTSEGYVTEEELIYYLVRSCLLYTSPSPRDRTRSRMQSSA